VGGREYRGTGSLPDALAIGDQRGELNLKITRLSLFSFNSPYTGHMAENAREIHGVGPSGADGDGQFFFASAQFIKKLQELYALPHLGFRKPEDSPTWPYHTFDRRFYFAAEKYWATVFKIDRVAELIDAQHGNIRDFSTSEIPVADFASHTSALNDLPIYLESLIVYLRGMADVIANLTPHLYGQRGEHLPRDRFRSQREWFTGKRKTFDAEFADILRQHTRWFDALAGTPDQVGLRDALIHYRGGIQIMYRPARTERPPYAFASLVSDENFLTNDLLSLLKLIVGDMFIFLDKFTGHFMSLANKSTNSSAFDIDTTKSTLLFLYKGRLPSGWLYPSIALPAQ
jgi:hypothetical protein